MVVWGSQQETVYLGLVLFNFCQKDGPVVLRELILRVRPELSSPRFTVGGAITELFELRLNFSRTEICVQQINHWVLATVLIHLSA